jgi:hypothetical protein
MRPCRACVCACRLVCRGRLGGGARAEPHTPRRELHRVLLAQAQHLHRGRARHQPPARASRICHRRPTTLTRRPDWSLCTVCVCLQFLDLLQDTLLFHRAFAFDLAAQVGTRSHTPSWHHPAGPELRAPVLTLCVCVCVCVCVRACSWCRRCGGCRRYGRRTSCRLGTCRCTCSGG